MMRGVSTLINNIKALNAQKDAVEIGKDIESATQANEEAMYDQVYEEGRPEAAVSTFYKDGEGPFYLDAQGQPLEPANIPVGDPTLIEDPVAIIDQGYRESIKAINDKWMKRNPKLAVAAIQELRQRRSSARTYAATLKAERDAERLLAEDAAYGEERRQTRNDLGVRAGDSTAAGNEAFRQLQAETAADELQLKQSGTYDTNREHWDMVLSIEPLSNVVGTRLLDLAENDPAGMDDVLIGVRNGTWKLTYADGVEYDVFGAKSPYRDLDRKQREQIVDFALEHLSAAKEVKQEGDEKLKEENRQALAEFERDYPGFVDRIARMTPGSDEAAAALTELQDKIIDLPATGPERRDYMRDLHTAVDKKRQLLSDEKIFRREWGESTNTELGVLHLYATGSREEANAYMRGVYEFSGPVASMYRQASKTIRTGMANPSSPEVWRAIDAMPPALRAYARDAVGKARKTWENVRNFAPVNDALAQLNSVFSDSEPGYRAEGVIGWVENEMRIRLLNAGRIVWEQHQQGLIDEETATNKMDKKLRGLRSWLATDEYGENTAYSIMNNVLRLEGEVRDVRVLLQLPGTEVVNEDVFGNSEELRVAIEAARAANTAVINAPDSSPRQKAAARGRQAKLNTLDALRREVYGLAGTLER